MPNITKAIFPVAGLGTRFLPATKANPKEMLPIVDKPLIQYAVEEALAAGIKELIFITSGSKRSIEDHFDTNFELETRLAEQGRSTLLKAVQQIVPEDVHCIYLRQPKPLGLGHAVLCAAPLIGNEPFAVLLADDLLDNTEGDLCLKQMVEAYYQNNHQSIVAVQEVTDCEIHKYGIVAPVKKTSQDKLFTINNIVEKPNSRAQAPSNLGAVGRYILNSAIFECLKVTQSGTGGEIQLTDAIALLLKFEQVYAYLFNGKRYDCGSKLGYLEATVVYGMRHPEIGSLFTDYLAKLNLK